MLALLRRLLLWLSWLRIRFHRLLDAGMQVKLTRRVVVVGDDGDAGQRRRMRLNGAMLLLLLLLLLSLLLLELIQIRNDRLGWDRRRRHRSVAAVVVVIVGVVRAPVVVVHDWRMVGLLLLVGRHVGRWMLLITLHHHRSVNVVASRFDGMLLLLLLLDQVLLVTQQVLLLLLRTGRRHYLAVVLRLKRRMAGTVDVAAQLLLLRRRMRTGRQGSGCRIDARNQRFANYSGVVERRRSVLWSHGADHRRCRPVKVLLLLRNSFRPDSGWLLRMRTDVLLLLAVLLVDVSGRRRIPTTVRIRLLLITEILSHLLLLMMLLMLLLLLLVWLMLLLDMVDPGRIVRAAFEIGRQAGMVDSDRIANHVSGRYVTDTVNWCRCVIMIGGLDDIASRNVSAVRRHVVRTHFKIESHTHGAADNKIVDCGWLFLKKKRWWSEEQELIECVSLFAPPTCWHN